MIITEQKALLLELDRVRPRNESRVSFQVNFPLGDYLLSLDYDEEGNMRLLVATTEKLFLSTLCLGIDSANKGKSKQELIIHDGIYDGTRG
jgi:hypothetical protein